MKIEKDKNYLFDTSAILTYCENEAGSDIVETIIKEAKSGKCIVYVSFMSIMEACYKTYQEKDKEAAFKLFDYLKFLPIRRVEVDDELILISAEIKACHNVSVADAWILATAKLENAKLIHKDPEFEQLKDSIPQIILPYKK